MADIRSWEHYPEFLERFEQEMNLSAEDIADMTISDLMDTLTQFNPDMDRVRLAARSLRYTATAMTAEGVEGAQLKWSDAMERWYWHDVETGRFTRAPSIPWE